jgi:hypothetical protein
VKLWGRSPGRVEFISLSRAEGGQKRNESHVVCSLLAQAACERGSCREETMVVKTLLHKARGRKLHEA